MRIHSNSTERLAFSSLRFSLTDHLWDCIPTDIRDESSEESSPWERERERERDYARQNSRSCIFYNNGSWLLWSCWANDNNNRFLCILNNDGGWLLWSFWVNNNINQCYGNLQHWILIISITVVSASFTKMKIEYCYHLETKTQAINYINITTFSTVQVSYCDHFYPNIQTTNFIFSFTTIEVAYCCNLLEA